jgi:PAS domain-containing protein
MLLDRAAIEAAKDIPTEDVHVEEWGGTVRLKGLTGAERDAYEASIVEMRGETRRYKLQNMRARLVALCLVDEDGRRLFADDQAVKALGKKSSKALDRLFDKARHLSGLSEDDIEELAEDFGEGPNGEDGTDSD